MQILQQIGILAGGVEHLVLQLIEFVAEAVEQTVPVVRDRVEQVIQQVVGTEVSPLA